MENLREGLLLGVGNPLLDISAVVTDSMLKKYDLKPDDAIMATDFHKPMYQELEKIYNAEYIAGGSVQNSLRVCQWILNKPKVTTYFGCVGNDDYAEILRNSAIQDGVNVQYQVTSEQPTGTCGVLITGTHRSLCANLAAAICFTPDHLEKDENKKLIDSAQYIYVSGFFIAVSPPSIKILAQHALTQNHTFIMNLSAPFVSQFYSQPLMELIPYVDILFGNETEMIAFAQSQNFGTEDLREIALKVCKLPKQAESKNRVVIITQGKNPVLLAHEGVITEVPVEVLPQDKIVDTNGAGDAFTGGFLAQLITKQPLDVCVKCGVYAASQIIQNSGCTFSGRADFNPSS